MALRAAQGLRQRLRHLSSSSAQGPPSRLWEGDGKVAEQAAREAIARAARELSCRFIGSIELPQELQAAQDAILQGRTGKRLRADADALTSRLKKMSRSKSKGGRNIVDEGGLVETAGMAAMRSLDRQLDYRGRGWQDVGSSAPSSSPAWVKVESDALQYGDVEAAAYVAARMPPSYAALHRVMDELAARLPDYRPNSMLDFGAGPCTAAWAAWSVWPGSPKDVVAVEASQAMVRVGTRLLTAAADLAEEEEDKDVGGGGGGKLRTGFVRYRPQLPPIGRGPGGGMHDLVVAAYVLGEVEPQLRGRTLRGLWDRTAPGGLLVLMEPGTPAGSATVRQARRQVLRREEKRQRQQQQQQQQQPGKPAAAGAHVVAPCAHDGRCPMDGTDGWCHFAQRVQRTRLSRLSRSGGAGGAPPRGFQDEKFSFVVLRRSPRGGAHLGATEVPIPRAAALPDLMQLGAAAVEAASAAAAAAAARDPVGMDKASVEASGARRSRFDGFTLPALPGESGPDIAEDEMERAARALDDMERQLLGGGEGARGVGEDEGDDDDHDDDDHAVLMPWPFAGASYLVDEGSGLAFLEDEDGWPVLAGRRVDGRLQAIEKGEGGMPAWAAEDVADYFARGGGRGAAAATMDEGGGDVDLGGFPGAGGAMDAEGGDESGSDATAVAAVAAAEEALDYARDSPEGRALEAAARGHVVAAAGEWGRLVRPPLKRGGHVILDICCSAAGGDTSRGVLERRVLARSRTERGSDGGDKGPKWYKRARKSRWGDIWPAWALPGGDDDDGSSSPGRRA